MGYDRLARGAVGAALAAALVVAGLTVSTTAAVALPNAADPLCATPAQPGGTPVKILTVGDSITSAAVGDYTWRYFAWEHLLDSGVNVDFVGPSQAITNPINGYTNNTDYVCAFDKDHYAAGGTFLSQYVAGANSPLKQQVTLDQANVLIMQIGLNDMFRTTGPGDVKDTAQQVFTNMQKAVTDAKAANPQIKIVICTVATTSAVAAPGSDQQNFRDFNALLEGAYPDSNTTDNVAIARTMKNWGGLDVTYDTEHPNVVGEVEIAGDIDTALHSLGVGDAVSALPDVSAYLGPRDPAALQAPLVAGNTATLTWVLPVGANTSQIERQDLTAGVGWHGVGARKLQDAPACKDSNSKPVASTPDPTLVMPITCQFADISLAGGHVYQYRIRVAKSFTFAANVTSNVQQITAQGPAAPGKVVASKPVALEHGILVSWASVPNATGYKIYYRRQGASFDSGPVYVTGTSRAVTGLTPGVGYYFAVAATSADAGDGTASNPVGAVPKYYTIAGPPKPKVVATAGHRFRATWTAKPHATRYLVQVRLGAGAWKNMVFVARNTYTSGKLVKGKKYSVRVRPYDTTFGGRYSVAGTVKVK